nr:hypothetical protein [Tanacetum cinerariifolium]
MLQLLAAVDKGTIDQTLFIRKHKGEFLLVQVYVDDIIFGSSNPQLCREFEALMHDKFQMSTMGELTFFLGLQALQKKDDIFLSQDKYVGDILKKFGYSDVRSTNTPIDKENPWGKDGPDSDYGGATQDRKSTTGGCQFLGRRLISWQCKKQTIVATSTTEVEYMVAASGRGQVLWIENQMLDYGFGLLQGSKQRMKKQRFSPLLLGEGSGTLTEPHHTPSPQAQQSSHHDPSSPSHPTVTTESIPIVTPIEIPTLRQYSGRATWIAQFKALSTAAD